MEELEDSIKHIFNKLYRDYRWFYWVSFFLALGGLCVAGYYVVSGVLRVHVSDAPNPTWNDIAVNIVATIAGVVLAYLIIRVIFLWAHRNEDKNKVSYSNVDMWKQYGTAYRQQFTLHKNAVFTVYCEKLIQNKKGLELIVKDDPNDYFSLDEFIKSQFFSLIEAHMLSDSANSVTVRLKKVEYQGENSVVMQTMRSTYLSHMLTNRALDYQMKPGISIRSLFENTDHLVPLERSRMSNHLGVNALVFLKGGEGNKWLLLPERGYKATVAKGKVTASIATRIKMENLPKGYLGELNADYILEGCIKDSIASSIMVDKNWLQTQHMETEFLGLSRDIYEGGKPTLFYAVYLDVDIIAYHQQRGTYLQQRKQERKARRCKRVLGSLYKEAEQIDEVKTIHIVDWSSVNLSERYAPQAENLKSEEQKEHNEDFYNKREDKAKLTFDTYLVTKKLRVKKKTRRKAFEQNLIANFWFYKGCPENFKSAQLKAKETI